MNENKFATYNLVNPPLIDTSFFKTSDPKEYEFNINKVRSKPEQLDTKPTDNSLNTEETKIKEEPLINLQVVQRASEVTKKQISTTKSMTFDSNSSFAITLNNKYKEVLSKYGLNPNLSKMLTAQDAIESGWGKSVKGKFNYGNITTNGNDYTVKTGNRKWKDFKSLDDYVEYKIKFLNNNRYKFFDYADESNVTVSMQRLADQGYDPGNKNYGNYTNKVYQSVLKYV